MVKERPILFSGPMVRAILDGQKTQTRRIAKYDHFVPKRMQTDYDFETFIRINPAYFSGDTLYESCPHGAPGDRLWVRESWAIHECGRRVSLSPEAWPEGWPINRLKYASTDEAPYIHSENDKPYWWNLRPSIHMPRWASRITLDILNVRFERLHSITQKDIRAEGGPDHSKQASAIGTKDADYLLDYGWFSNLWDKINGKKHPWASNPYVWVVEFRQSHNANPETLNTERTENAPELDKNI